MLMEKNTQSTAWLADEIQTLKQSHSKQPSQILHLNPNPKIPTLKIPTPTLFLPTSNNWPSRPMNIIICMFLGDPQSLVTHLNNDWSILLRNLKTLEDHHLFLLQYNQRIINQVRSQNSELFIKDEILQHQRQHSRVMDCIVDLEREELDIVEKYEGLAIKQDGVVKLMTRVGARIVETCQSAVEKCKNYDESIVEKHTKMRKGLIQLLNHKQGIKLEDTIKCVISYSREKLTNQMDKLKKLISALENGEHFKLREVYFPKQKKRVKSVERKLDLLRDLSKAKAEKQSQKVEQKNNEKIKKQRQKMMNQLYSTMELAKQHLNHEDQHQSTQQKIEKLYNEILSRNKFNSDQILEFQSKKEAFEQKVRVFKEYIEGQGKKIHEVFIRKPIKRQKQESTPQAPSKDIEPSSTTQKKSLMSELQTNIENIMTQGNLDPSNKVERRVLTSQQFKFKSISAKKDINDLPNLFSSFVNAHENLSNFKFDPAHRDIYSRTNRNALPDISKNTSLDQKTQITKIKIEKILRTTIKNDQKMHEEGGKKGEYSRKTAVINRDDIKIIEDATKFRINFKNIDFGTEVLKRNVIDRHKNDLLFQDHSLNVKKAQLRHYEPKLNILF